jgi:hypothetical protein
MKDTIENFKTAMQEYRNLNPKFRELVRREAVQELIDSGSQEVGSSDINHSIYQMYRQYGSMDDVVQHCLDNFFATVITE